MENEFDKRDVNRILIKQECLDENKQQEFPVATPSLLENGQRYVWNINKVNENTKQNLNKTKDAELIDYNNRDDCGDTKGEFVAENSLKNETNIGNFNLFHSNVFLKNCEDNTNANKMKPENTIEKTDSPIINWNVDVQTNYQVPNKSDKIYNILLITPVHSKLLNVQECDNESEKLKKGNEKERLSCNVCDKTYTKASSLVVHYRLHTGDKPYSCSLCEKTFTYSSSLLFHNRTHTGEKPFSCNICGKSFSRLGHVKTHKLTHTSETPYTCDICKHKFKHKSSLPTAFSFAPPRCLGYNTLEPRRVLVQMDDMAIGLKVGVNLSDMQESNIKWKSFM
ncbi:unnamed protein product, partial [Leptidea sinapis]